MKTGIRMMFGLCVGLMVVQHPRAEVLTASEIAVLPPYCQVRLSGDEAANKMWRERLGPDQYLHLHHYCFGLGFLSRARTQIERKEKQFTLKGAIRNFNYVLERWPATFPLTAQARTLKAQAESMLAMR